MPVGEVVVTRGFAATSLPWTAVSVVGNAIAGTSVDTGGSLVVLEGALRKGLSTGMTKQSLLDCTAKIHPGPTGATINKLIDLADVRSDSPAESLMRAILIDLGITDHQQQVIIGDAQGNFVARVDFMLMAYNIVFEVDGDGKYNGAFGDPYDQLNRERRRHNAITNLGYQVIRISWKQLHNGEARQLVMAAVKAPNSTSRIVRGSRRLTEKITFLSDYGREELRWSNTP